MFGSDFQTSADMPLHQLLEVFIIPHCLVFLGSAVVQEQIVADAGSHRGFLDLGMLVNLLVVTINYVNGLVRNKMLINTIGLFQMVVTTLLVHITRMLHLMEDQLRYLILKNVVLM